MVILILSLLFFLHFTFFILKKLFYILSQNFLPSFHLHFLSTYSSHLEIKNVFKHNAAKNRSEKIHQQKYSKAAELHIGKCQRMHCM